MVAYAPVCLTVGAKNSGATAYHMAGLGPGDLHHEEDKNREDAQDDGNPAELNDQPGQQVQISACGPTRAG